MGKLQKSFFMGVAIVVAGLCSPLPASFAADDNLTLCDGSGDRDCVCASRDAAEALPPLPTGCHKERITAAGELSYGIVRSANYLARKAWQRQALEKYGERFQRWELAACRSVECGPGSLSGTKRCTYSGYACSPDVDTRVLADLRRPGRDQAPPEYYERASTERRVHRELEPEEIRELQRLLNRAGYSVEVDGQFGEATSEALIKWQRRAGVRDDGEATIENLEMLRHRGG